MQVKNPSVDIPVGMIGATSIACVLYVLLALVLCAMVPAARLDPAAPFASAFAALASAGSGAWRAAFLHTSARFVSFGAFTGDFAAHNLDPSGLGLHLLRHASVLDSVPVKGILESDGY